MELVGEFGHMVLRGLGVVHIVMGTGKCMKSIKNSAQIVTVSIRGKQTIRARSAMEQAR